jgi:hypothetical protein
MSTAARSATIGLLLGAVVGTAGGQEVRQIEPGIDDLNPGRTGSRVLPIDQRRAGSFDRVFQATTPNGGSFFFRVGGGLFATFDRSVFDERTGAALIPPGTRFFIGPPPLPAEPEPVRSNNAVDLRADTSARPGPALLGRKTPTQPRPSIADNELYRRARINQLLLTILKPAEPKAQQQRSAERRPLSTP